MEHSQSAPDEPVAPADHTITMPGQVAQQGQYDPYALLVIPAPSDYDYAPWQPGAPYAQPQPLAAAQPAQPARMPRHEAVAVTQKLKAILIAGSVMALGVLTALAAGHVTGVTARQSTGAASSSSATSPNTSSSSSSSSSSNSGSFFNQLPSNNTGTSSGFGVSSSAPFQQPVSGSSFS